MWIVKFVFTINKSDLVSLDGEGQEGEHAHADSQGGGEGVDAAVDGPKYPLSGHRDTQVFWIQ